MKTNSYVHVDYKQSSSHFLICFLKFINFYWKGRCRERRCGEKDLSWMGLPPNSVMAEDEPIQSQEIFPGLPCRLRVPRLWTRAWTWTHINGDTCREGLANWAIMSGPISYYLLKKYAEVLDELLALNVLLCALHEIYKALMGQKKSNIVTIHCG